MQTTEIRAVNLADIAKAVEEGQLDSSLKSVLTNQEVSAFEAYADDYQEGERIFDKVV